MGGYCDAHVLRAHIAVRDRLLEFTDRTESAASDEIAAKLRTWVNQVDQLQVRLPLGTSAELVEQIERFGAEVAPLVGGGG